MGFLRSNVFRLNLLRVGAVLLLPFGLALAQAPATDLTSQLGEGQTLYFLSCAMCHGDHLEGVSAPALSGPDFRLHYEGLHRRGLSDFIQIEMPLDRPASLTDAEVLALTAYVLHQNGAKFPPTGLNAAQLDEAIHFGAKP